MLRRVNMASSLDVAATLKACDLANSAVGEGLDP